MNLELKMKKIKHTKEITEPYTFYYLILKFSIVFYISLETNVYTLVIQLPSKYATKIYGMWYKLDYFPNNLNGGNQENATFNDLLADSEMTDKFRKEIIYQIHLFNSTFEEVMRELND